MSDGGFRSDQDPPGRLPLEAFQECLTDRRPRGRVGTFWRDRICHRGGERLGVPPGGSQPSLSDRL